MDLNCDLGEGFGVWQLGDDLALLDVVTSANVACGFHAGDPVTMRRICAAAVRRGVAIGAQVGYRDLAGFGRRRIDYDPDDLAAEVLYQVGALQAMAVAAGGRVSYVKPHGALYNTAAVDPGQAGAVVAALLAYQPSLPLLCLPGSVLADTAGRAALTVVAEGFVDRGYTTEGRLVPRSRPDALVTDPEQVVARAVRMAVDGTVTSVDGVDVRCPVQSLCVHGDTPGALALARRVRAGLRTADVPLRPFVGGVEPAQDER